MASYLCCQIFNKFNFLLFKYKMRNISIKYFEFVSLVTILAVYYYSFKYKSLVIFKL